MLTAACGMRYCANNLAMPAGISALPRALNVDKNSPPQIPAIIVRRVRRARCVLAPVKNKLNKRHAGAAQPAISVRIFGEILLMLGFGVIKFLTQ